MKRNSPDYTEKILARFKGRCIICLKSAENVHEIIPRSLKRDWTEEGNQVTLCYKCHREIHDKGASSAEMVQYLKSMRDRRLKEFYGETA